MGKGRTIMRTLYRCWSSLWSTLQYVVGMLVLLVKLFTACGDRPLALQPVRVDPTWRRRR